MIKKLLLGFAALVVGLLLLLVGLIWWLNEFPPETQAAEMSCDASKTVPLKPGTRLKILVWNIQYAASRKTFFWYDGGRAVMADPAKVAATLEAIRAVVKKHDPDIIFWQEFDRTSKRTGYQDQIKEILKGKSYPCWSATWYHRSAYVPSPAHQHLGRVSLELGIFSRFKMTDPIRHALPQLKADPITTAFYLKRAILQNTLPVEGGKPLVLLNTHLDAFSYGDGTMEKQVQKLAALSKTIEASGASLLVAGDMNLLPPGDNPKRLGKEANFYNDKTNPIELLYKELTPAVRLEEYKKNPSAFYTYLPYGAKAADRWIDHVFLGKTVKLETYRVMTEYPDISDHLPIWLEVTLPK